MSYILEALKKAQAERQLGNAPTIHAPQALPAAPAAAATRMPLYVGAGVGVAIVVVGALVLWRPAPTVAPATVTAATVPAPAARVATTDALVVQAPAAPDPAPVRAPGSADAVKSTAAVQPRATAGAGNAAANSAANSVANAVATSAGTSTAMPVGGAASAAPGARASASVPATAAVTPAATPAPASTRPPEDNVPYLAQLPDTQQREIPRVAFGGYMYSANPADRLLLVDKVLRHEGEEVAPGLVLEKLLPKAAVMNYRGLRYRVPY